MAHREPTNRSDGALDDIQAGLSANDVVSPQEDAPRASETDHLLAGDPSNLQLADEQIAASHFVRNPCPRCNHPQEDWQRDVHFAVKDDHNAEHKVLAGALFDTGTEVDNFLSADFVREAGIQFQRCTDVKETQSWWKRLLSKLRGKHSRLTHRTVDRRPIKIIGVVKNQRWRGLEEARCTKGVSFTPQYLTSDFFVAENLAYDAIFSSKTMNHHRLRGNCTQVAAFYGQMPDPTKDPEAYKRWKEEKKKQERIQREQEQDKQRKNSSNK
ncbi:hypothetical protein GTA08_BOTSDO02502 [Botryosphaeria dothidea]|uniref:Uncharacterized protein n=1 Tax=Botryosphaeria dothidea TaxID=55169 RepID=A0A8H4J1T2_9PEZI|nr:hypothetical protein GTA08_BOTSDO02502 [Botryosphaeria dothidea]